MIFFFQASSAFSQPLAPQVFFSKHRCCFVVLISSECKQLLCCHPYALIRTHHLLEKPARFQGSAESLPDFWKVDLNVFWVLGIVWLTPSPAPPFPIWKCSCGKETQACQVMCGAKLFPRSFSRDLKCVWDLPSVLCPEQAAPPRLCFELALG